MPAPDFDECTLLEIARLAGIEPDIVRTAYQCEWQRLESTARIFGFIHLLALKHVRTCFTQTTLPEKTGIFSCSELNDSKNSAASRAVSIRHFRQPILSSMLPH